MGRIRKRNVLHQFSRDERERIVLEVLPVRESAACRSDVSLSRRRAGSFESFHRCLSFRIL